jgi:hypothetical protein
MILQEGMTLNFIHSPGHSKGSLNVLFAEDKILFTADSIPLKNDIPNYDNYPQLMKSLEAIEKAGGYQTLLTSWTPPLANKAEIVKLIGEGREYMERIDSAVKECYKMTSADTLEYCKLTVNRLGLPPFLVNSIVDKAFQSHLHARL